jgi:fructose-1,6-bisphosphatase
MGPHLKAPYGFWGHMNFLTKKDSIYLNTATNNFLEGTNFNYSCIPLNTPGCCRQDYVMPEIHTANPMLNIFLCSMLVTLKAKDVIPITNYYTANRIIKNLESPFWIL